MVDFLGTHLFYFRLYFVKKRGGEKHSVIAAYSSKLLSEIASLVTLYLENGHGEETKRSRTDE